MLSLAPDEINAETNALGGKPQALISVYKLRRAVKTLFCRSRINAEARI